MKGNMKNWKTTMAGAVSALGVYLTTIPDLQVFGQILTGIGTFLMGMFAKDSNVTGGTKQQ